MTHPQVGHMGNFAQLLDHRTIDLLHAMPKEIAPQRTCSIEISLAMDIGKPTALRVLDDQSVVLGHLRKGMPDDGPVQFAKPCRLACVHLHGHSRHACTVLTAF